MHGESEARMIRLQIRLGAQSIGTRYGLRSSGIRDVDELVEKHRVLIVVPVPEHHGELLVIGVDLLSGVDHQRSAQAVDILSLFECTRMNIAASVLRSS